MNYVNDDFFDKAYCLTCFNKERINHCKKEFEKHNLNVEFWYNPTIPRLDRFIKNYKGIDYYDNPTYSEEFNNHRKMGAMMCGIGHYNITKTAYELGYERLLVFEDDITFKDNINFHKMFSLIPEDADVIAYHVHGKAYYSYTNSYLTSNIYRKYNVGLEPIRSTKMYYINRRAQKEIIRMYENWLDVSDLMWNNFPDDFNCYINTYNIFKVINNIEYSLIDH